MSRICADIDEEVAVFRTRPLGHVAMPYVYLDATYVKARSNHRIVSCAVVVATAVCASGDREVLGVNVGDSEDEVFWTSFLRWTTRPRPARRPPGHLRRPRRPESLDRPRVRRCQLATMQGSPDAQPPRHRRLGIQGHGRGHRAHDLRPARRGHYRSQLHDVVGILEDRFTKAAELLAAAEADVSAYATFPRAHWRKIASTNPLERVNKEIKRRSNVVGIFPDHTRENACASLIVCGVRCRLLRGMHEVSIEQRQFGLIWRLGT